MEKNINKKIYYLNFKRENKWLGIVDYKLLCITLLYLIIVIKILSYVKISITSYITLISFLLVPIITLFIVSYKEENSLETLISIFKYILIKGIYILDYDERKFKGKIYKNYIVK